MGEAEGCEEELKMTAIVGFHADDFIILGADGRVTEVDGTFEDTKEKVQSLPLGLIASSGSVGFGDLVIYMMSRTERPEHLRTFIERAFEDLTVDATPDFREQLQKLTSWVISYRENGRLILAASHPMHDHAEHRAPPGDFVFVPPTNMSDADSNGLAAFLRDKTRELCATTESRAVRMERFALLAQFAIEQSAQRCVTVGPTFQLGLHTVEGIVQISELMSNIGECRWRTATRDCR